MSCHQADPGHRWTKDGGAAPGVGADGVSFVVCCFNSGTRIGPTLAHLAAQEDPAGGAWDVVLVDNASTDGTGRVAVEAWRTRAANHAAGGGP